MVILQSIVPPEKLEPFKGKTVEYVCKSFLTSPFLGKVPGWRGALENEYFSIGFVSGVLAVSISECEYKLGASETTLSLAESKTLSNMLTALKGEDELLLQKVQLGYHKNIAPQEQMEITLEDIMAFLDWKYAQLAKIDEDYLSEISLSSLSS